MANPLDLLLLGKTGVGKSASGNTIIGSKVFETGSSTSSITQKSRCEQVMFNGRTIRVVDGPGVGDTRMDSEDAARRSVTSIEEAMRMSNGGFHAFLLVFRFGSRFTKEEKETIEFLKSTFGQELLSKFGIVVMTCGDSFERDSEETGQTFHQWCEEQTGVFRDLYRECQGRAVIFNNVARNPSSREAQVGNLLRIVDSLAYTGRTYTSYDFSLSSMGRNTVILRAMKSSIVRETTREASNITQELQNVQSRATDHDKLTLLQNLLTRSDQLIQKLRGQDLGTGVLNDVIETVMPTQRSISEAVRAQQRANREKARLAQLEEQRRREAEENRRRQEELRRAAEQQRREEERRRAEEMERDRRRREEEERQAREREAQLQRQLEEERERSRQRERELEEARREAARRPRSRSPPVEKKVVREVGRVVNQIGRLFKF